MPPEPSLPSAEAAAELARLRAALTAERAARRQAEATAAALRAEVAQLRATGTTAPANPTTHRVMRRMEAVTELLVRALPIGVLMLDASGRVVLANRRFTELLGRKATLSLGGWRMSEWLRLLLPHFARPDEVRAWSRVIPRQAVPVRNLLLPLTDGRVIEADVQPISESEGGGWLLAARDVTARETARRTVAEQRAFYETVLNHLPSDVAVLDPEHRYRFVNPAGVADPAIRQWIVGRTDAEYCAYRQRPMEMADRRYALFEQAIRERRLIMWEERLTAADGTTRTLRRHLQPVFESGPDGAPLLMIGYGIDVTALRHAQHVIDDQRSFYETILDNLPADVAVFDADLRYCYLNPQAQPDAALRTWVVGRTWEEFVAHAHISASRAQQRREVVTQVLTTRRVVSWDEPIPHPLTGAERIYRRHLQPLFHASGALRLIIGYGVDITLVREAQRAAEQAARARENFLANMSHEIRTPLNGVLGMVAILAKTSLTATQREYLEIVGASGRHLLGVLNDVLDMAKITSGHLELEEAQFVLADVLHAVAQQVAFRAAEQGVALRLETASPLRGGVVGDAYRLQQVLLNLLTNAIKFTPKGTVTLQLNLLAVTPDVADVRFSVTDTGLGIPPERQDAIFEEFTQAYTDTTRRFGGTGLGLAISQRLVAQMGGHLVLASTEGAGTTFSFTLRLRRTTAALTPLEVAAPLAVVPAPIPRLDGCRILVVEDQDVNRLLVRLLLEANGATVAEAVNGPKALAWLVAHPPPTVVLMDIQMPGLSGVDTTRRIRAFSDPARAAVPIIALTANAFRSDVDRYLAAGMNACLTKPFEEADLMQLIASLAPTDRVRPPAPAAAPVPATATPAAAAAAFPATLLKMGRGDADFARRIVGVFVAGGPEALAGLRAAAAALDGAAAAALAHRLAPSVRLLEEPELADTLSELETLPVTDGSWPDALAFAIQELESLLTRLAALL